MFVGELKVVISLSEWVVLFLKSGGHLPWLTAVAVLFVSEDSDVFGAPTTPVLKEPQKPEQPDAGKSSHVPAASGLFDDDDNDDFFTASSNKPSKTGMYPSSWFWGFGWRKLWSQHGCHSPGFCM